MPSISPPHREKSGKVKRQTMSARRKHDRSKYEAQIATVLAQPHRREFGDNPLSESAMGRFCLANKLRAPIFAAATYYAGLVRRWRAAKGVPRTEANVSGGSSEEGPTRAQVAVWTRELESIERAIRAIERGPAHWRALRILVIDGNEVPAEWGSICLKSLTVLAEVTGYLEPPHPFA